jgi:hypothetical protein
VRNKPDLRVVVVVLAAELLVAGAAFAQSQQEKQRPANEGEVILQDSKKHIPETPKEIAECMKQWGPNTQMTKEEWAASCRSTLRYFPEKP